MAARMPHGTSANWAIVNASLADAASQTGDLALDGTDEKTRAETGVAALLAGNMGNRVAVERWRLAPTVVFLLTAVIVRSASGCTLLAGIYRHPGTEKP